MRSCSRQHRYVFVSAVLLPLCGCARSDLSVPFEQFRLDNGLNVILARDATAPIVTTNIWYHVGSKDEQPGRTGFAHLFEHLMFKGSQNVGLGQFDIIMEEAGGWNNGSTSYDRTNYFNVGPPNALETLLWLEADRLGTLAAAMTPDKLTIEREVVRNERRQNTENRPYGMVRLLISEQMFPPEHPYHWSVIGSHADLVAASVADVTSFFHRYYVPANASLCIAGDFDPAQTRRLVKRYFGWIPRADEPARPAPAPAVLASVKRETMSDDVTLPRLYMVWHSPALYAPGDADLDIASAVLADGKNSRLYKRLVYDLKVAQDVSAFQESRELSGLFQIVVTAKPGTSLDDLERLVDAELRRAASTPPTQREIDRARNGIESAMLWGLETVRAKADLLNTYHTFLGQTDGLGRDLARYHQATADSVRDTIARVLDLDRRLIVHVTPGAKAVLAEKQPEAPPADATDADAPAPARVEHPDFMAQPPALPPSAPLRMPKIQDLTLDNGLRVLLVEREGLPLVHLQVLAHGGANLDPPDRVGLSIATLDMMDEGAGSRSALEIADELDYLGAQLFTSAGGESARVSLRVLQRHLDSAVPLLVDVLTRPTFAAEEWSRVQNELVTAARRRRDFPQAVAQTVFSRALYEGHPYGRPVAGTVPGLETITADDLRACFDRLFKPTACTLIVVGNVDQHWLRNTLQPALAHWTGDAPSLPVVPTVDATAKRPRLVTVAFPNAPQSVVLIGHPLVARRDPDYPALQALNAILGGSFTARLNWNLREQKGYTYGARSSFRAGAQPGPFAARAAVRANVTLESVQEMLGELRRIVDEPVTDAELAKAKAQRLARFPQQLETLAGTVALLGDLARYDLPLDYHDGFFETFGQLTVADLQAAARKHLRPDTATICVVGDEKHLATLAEIHEPPQVRDREGALVAP